MYDINILLKKAKQNNNKISISDINKLEITEEEYDEILKKLSAKNIEILEEKADIINTINEDDYIYTSDDEQKLYNDISKYPLLTKEEEKDLFLEYNTTGKKELRTKLINCNLRLVASIAKKYSYGVNSLSFLDLFGEGCLGLMKSIDKFDISKGYKFSTYATWWIRQSISRFIAENDRTIRIPVHSIENIKKIKKYQEVYFQEKGKEASYEEISKALDIDVEEIRHLLHTSLSLKSLDKTIGEEDTILQELVPDNTTNIEETAINKIYSEDLIEQMEIILTDREFFVIMRRNGLMSNKPTSLESIGAELGVTRERVRQIERKAYLKIRRNLQRKESIVKNKIKR